MFSDKNKNSASVSFNVNSPVNNSNIDQNFYCDHWILQNWSKVKKGELEGKISVKTGNRVTINIEIIFNIRIIKSSE